LSVAWELLDVLEILGHDRARAGEPESRHALLAIDAVVSLQEPPFDPALSLEAFLGVAEIVAGMQLVEAAGLQPGEEDDREPS
jgi:hypothetical protein